MRVVRKIDKQRLAKEADKLFSKFIRGRDKHCLYCGSTYDLDCAHIVGQKRARLRFDPQNAIALCRLHHTDWHAHQNIWEGWFHSRYPDRWAYLEKYRYVTEKPDYEAVIKKFQWILDGS